MRRLMIKSKSSQDPTSRRAKPSTSQTPKRTTTEPVRTVSAWQSSKLSAKRYRNAWERQYAEYLQVLLQAGKIDWWDYEAVSLSLGQGVTYKPDFLVIRNNTVEFHEVKGRRREAGMVRFRVARSLYPFFRWIMVSNSKDGWKELSV